MHDLKLRSEYYHHVLCGQKRFEVRFNDRNYQVGDSIRFYEVDSEGRFTGFATGKLFRITYILRESSDFGIKAGWCVFGFTMEGGEG